MRLQYWSRAVFPSAATHSLSMAKFAASLFEAGCEVELLGYAGSGLTESAKPSSLGDFYGVDGSIFLLRNSALGRASARFRASEPGGRLMGRWLSSRLLMWEADAVYSRLTSWELGSLPRSKPLIYEMHSLGVLAKGTRAASVVKQALAGRPRSLVVVTTNSLAARVNEMMPSVPTLVSPLAGEDAMAVDLRYAESKTRSSVATGEGHLNVGYVGYVDKSELRGIPLLYRLARILRDVEFHIVGGPDAEAGWWRDLASREGLRNFHTYGRQPPDAVPYFLRSMDVLVSPTQLIPTESAPDGRNASPLKVAQYMSSAVPIVASDIPAHRERLVDGQTALLVGSASEDEWVRAIRSLRNNLHLSQRLAESARMDYLKALTPAHRARAILEAVREWI